MAKINSYKGLDVYKNAFEAAMSVFTLTKGFPAEEKYSLVDQVRRSTRSICTGIAEAWRRRRYRAAFVSKLNESETEAAETQVHLQFALECGYLDAKTVDALDDKYEHIMAQLIRMIQGADHWVVNPNSKKKNV
ncbi:MAG: four helix bundle protein [Ignavibacteriales bacterium]|nr:four helix bundle protein [Ignavibacteriales bacterium]